MGKQLGVRVSEELYGRVEAARGDVPRSRFVERALEAALVDTASSGPGRAARGTAEPASPRASANYGALSRPTSEKESQGLRNTAENMHAEAAERLRARDAKAAIEAAGLNRFKCGCVTSATSRTARCPKHGRSLKV